MSVRFEPPKIDRDLAYFDELNFPRSFKEKDKCHAFKFRTLRRRKCKTNFRPKITGERALYKLLKSKQFRHEPYIHCRCSYNIGDYRDPGIVSDVCPKPALVPLRFCKKMKKYNEKEDKEPELNVNFPMRPRRDRACERLMRQTPRCPYLPKEYATAVKLRVPQFACIPKPIYDTFKCRVSVGVCISDPSICTLLDRSNIEYCVKEGDEAKEKPKPKTEKIEKKPDKPPAQEPPKKNFREKLKRFLPFTKSKKKETSPPPPPPPPPPEKGFKTFSKAVCDLATKENVIEQYLLSGDSTTKCGELPSKSIKPDNKKVEDAASQQQVNKGEKTDGSKKQHDKNKLDQKHSAGSSVTSAKGNKKSKKDKGAKSLEKSNVETKAKKERPKDTKPQNKQTPAGGSQTNVKAKPNDKKGSKKPAECISYPELELVPCEDVKTKSKKGHSGTKEPQNENKSTKDGSAKKGTKPAECISYPELGLVMCEDEKSKKGHSKSEEPPKQNKLSSKKGSENLVPVATKGNKKPKKGKSSKNLNKSAERDTKESSQKSSFQQLANGMFDAEKGKIGNVVKEHSGIKEPCNKNKLTTKKSGYSLEGHKKPKKSKSSKNLKGSTSKKD